jgi:hypothetical protein
MEKKANMVKRNLILIQGESDKTDWDRPKSEYYFYKRRLHLHQITNEFPSTTLTFMHRSYSKAFDCYLSEFPFFVFWRRMAHLDCFDDDEKLGYSKKSGVSFVINWQGKYYT